MIIFRLSGPGELRQCHVRCSSRFLELQAHVLHCALGHALSLVAKALTSHVGPRALFLLTEFGCSVLTPARSSDAVSDVFSQVGGPSSPSFEGVSGQLVRILCYRVHNQNHSLSVKAVNGIEGRYHQHYLLSNVTEFSDSSTALPRISLALHLLQS